MRQPQSIAEQFGNYGFSQGQIVVTAPAVVQFLTFNPARKALCVSFTGAGDVWFGISGQVATNQGMHLNSQHPTMIFSHIDVGGLLGSAWDVFIQPGNFFNFIEVVEFSVPYHLGAFHDLSRYRPQSKDSYSGDNGHAVTFGEPTPDWTDNQPAEYEPIFTGIRGASGSPRQRTNGFSRSSNAARFLPLGTSSNGGSPWHLK